MVLSRESNRSRLALLSFAAVLAVAFSLILSPSLALAEDVGVNAHNVPGGDYECDATEWHFVIVQVDSEANAPATITVVWENTAVEVVPLDNFTGGTAHYRTTSNLDSKVVAATAVIYDGWDGNFNLSHGPCVDPTETPTDVPTETPTDVPTETPTDVPTETPTDIPTETPTNTPEVTTTGTVGGEQETPVSSETPTDEPTDEPTEEPTGTSVPPTNTATDPVDELPNTGTAPEAKATTGILGALVLALVLAGTGFLVRRRSMHASN